ncbi:MAG: Gfo/Idh/MocA family oxidoreductase [Bacteroidia bacterium]|nr:Gfo/Idh/MocA family oxidoreductase [Bacteroidia bacterium]
MEKVSVGFIGSGGIAKAHVYALTALPFYYESLPKVELSSVCSSRAESREAFARRYSFEKAEDLQNFARNSQINTVYILGPNKVHFEHLQVALSMPQVDKIYLEKPVCGSHEEEKALGELLGSIPASTSIQIGFQYLQISSIREALNFWKSGVLGKALHFDLKYYHGDYLQQAYRDKRRTRLTPAPDGGAMADLGSHGISLLCAFLGENLQIQSAFQAGNFEDVPEDSDLFSSLSLYEPKTGAVGHMSASRISSGTGDLIAFELYGEKGTLKFSTHEADYFEYYLEESGEWSKKIVSSRYEPISSFPSKHVPTGWLRSMVHAHYMFLTGNRTDSFLPDLSHGLAVQRLVRETADKLREFRKFRRK